MGKKTPELIRLAGDIAYVPLTKGFEAIVDAADVALVAGRNWYCHSVAGIPLYACTNGNDGRNEKRGTIRMHRHILGLPRSGIIVDHINGCGLDNRRSNLRLATAADNAANISAHKDTEHGIKGICWAKYAQKWRARIMRHGEVHDLGYFASRAEAADAYRAAALKLQGAFAKL